MTIVSVRHPDEPECVDADTDLAVARKGDVRARLTDLGPFATALPTPGVDLLTVAIAAYAADKVVLRDAFSDRWTRDLELRVPLLSRSKWPTALTEELLNRLSGDHWRLVTRDASEPLIELPRYEPAGQLPTSSDVPKEIALLSGGLDSLSYLAECQAAGGGIDFVAHSDRNAPRSLQRDLFDAVDSGKRTARLHQFAIEASDPTGEGERERTTRVRGFLFVAAATAVALAHGTSTVTIPENGFVSINVPISPNRIGALTTRTTHPMTVARYQQLLDALGLDVTLSTPYMLLTKGEVMALGRDAGLTEALLSRTVSCARPTQGRWSGQPFGNCGYCYACLVRRASLCGSGGDATVYRHDPRRQLLKMGKQTQIDFRSLVTWLKRPLRASALLASGSIPIGFDTGAAVDMLNRGRHELTTMIDDGLTAAVRKAISW